MTNIGIVDDSPDDPSDERTDDAVPIEDIPRDVPYLQLGDHAVLLNLSLYRGDWQAANGEWTGVNTEIDEEAFLKASPTLCMAVGDDLKLTLYEAEYTAGRAELYYRQDDGDLAMEWKGDFGGSRWTEWVDGSERMLNDGVYYLIFSFEQYGDTRDGMTEHWEYLAPVTLVVGDAGTEQPIETTPGEIDPPVPSDSVPADTSLLTELLTSSDRQNGWWELPDKRALVTTLIEGQISYVLPTGERISTDTAAPIYQFVETEDAVVLHCTVDDFFTNMTFNLPSDLKADECTLRYRLYDQTGNNVLLSANDIRDFTRKLATFFDGRGFDIEQYVLEVSITCTTAGEDGSSTETEYGALTHLVVWYDNGGMRYSLAEGENICISAGSEVSLTVKGVWNGAATAVYTDQLVPSIRLNDTANDRDYKCSVLIPATEEHRVVRNGDGFSWVIFLPDTLPEGTYGIWADGYGSSGIKLAELTVSKDMITTYTDTSVASKDELIDAAFWWELPDGRCVAGAKCYGSSMEFDKNGNLCSAEVIEPLIQLADLDVIPTLVISSTTALPDGDGGYLSNMVFHMKENTGYERRGNYLILNADGDLLDCVDVSGTGVYYVQVNLVKYGQTIDNITETFNLHIMLRVVVE